MKPLRWVAFVVFFALAVRCHGGRVSYWRIYNASDGLPETPVSSVSIGLHDRVWVRHPNVDWAGRLDGFEVTAVPPPGPGNTRIIEGPGNQIWNFGTDGLKSYLRNDPEWVHYDLPEINEQAMKGGQSLAQRSTIWPLRQNHVLLQLPDELLEINTEDPRHPKATVMKKAGDTALERFTGLAVSQEKVLWLTGEKGVAWMRLDASSNALSGDWNEAKLDEAGGVHSLQEPEFDHEGGLITLGESSTDGRQRIICFNGGNWSVKPVPAQGAIHAWETPDGAWWLATHEALWSSGDGGNRFVKEEGLDAHRIFDIAVAGKGVFWAATSDGLYRHAPALWQPPGGNFNDNESSTGMMTDRNFDIWICGGGGVRQKHLNSWDHYVLPVEPGETPIAPRRIWQISSQEIVVSDGEKTYKFDAAKRSFNLVTNGQTKNLKALGTLNDGRLVVQSGGSGSTETALRLELYDGAGFAPLVEEPVPEPIGTNFEFAFQSKNNDVWLCGAEGIARHDGKKWRFYSNIQTPGLDACSCMMDSGAGAVWCGLQDKIVQFDGNSWATVRAGFYHVRALFMSRDGSIWTASDNGVQRFYHGSWCANGTEEGLPGGPVMALSEDKDGDIWASTTQGVFVRHPEADTDPPRTFAQELPDSRRDDAMNEGSIVTISFGGQDKWKNTPSDKLLYSFQLDGRNWSPYQEQRSATFLDLAIGTHAFHVRCMDRNWNEDPKPAVLEFVIAPPWYKESRLVLTTLVGGCVAIFFAALAYNRHRRLVKSYAEVEKMVAQRTRELDVANRELFQSQKMNALGTLAAGVAHDFNNILSIIKGSTQIIEENLGNPEKIRTRTGRIKTVVEQGSGIVRAMLGFSRTSDQPPVMCDIEEIVRETITLLGDRNLREARVEFRPDPAGIPGTAASRDFIQQILINFILNASEAISERKEIILRTFCMRDLPASPVLKPSAAGEYIFLSVQDFGTGIAPEIMPRIFEPFFTTKSMSSRRGTGLGLSMVYQLAERMDCGLAVESAPGAGSTFTLIIPVREKPAGEPENDGSKLYTHSKNGNEQDTHR
jgi:signal transduction histidine kinase